MPVNKVSKKSKKSVTNLTKYVDISGASIPANKTVIGGDSIMMTSKPPKIIRSNALTYKDMRTVVWLQKGSESTARWSGVVSSLEEYREWRDKGINIIGVIITELSSYDPEVYDELFEISKNVAVMLVSNGVLRTKSLDYWLDNYDNLINLDDVSELYPFIRSAWNGTREDAVAIFVMILRYNRLVLQEDVVLSNERSAILREAGIRVERGSKPAECWLFTQFFKHGSNRRNKELRRVLAENCKCACIDKIVLLNEEDLSFEWEKIPGAAGKIQQVIIKKRLSYADFIRYVNEVVPENVYCILANADIYFDESLRDLWKVNMVDKMFALLRWDVPADIEEEPKLFGPRDDSQDSWIVLSDSIKSRTWTGDKGNAYEGFWYELGKPGCDNRFTSDMLKKKFAITNPALTIRSLHVHTSNIRNYDYKDMVRSDMYLYVQPSALTDMRQISANSLKTEDFLNNESVGFEIKGNTLSGAITYCTMLERQKRYVWEAGVENFYFDKIPVYRLKNTAVTSNGLMYDMGGIYVGAGDNGVNEFSDDLWSTANVSIFNTMIWRKKMLAIPAPPVIFKDFNTYCLQYVARAARMRKLYPDASFWIPREFGGEMLKFDWGVSQLNAVEYKEDGCVYADEVIGLLPDQRELGAEDISALRELYDGWLPKVDADSKRCVVLSDGALFTEEFTGMISETLGGGWIVDTASSTDNYKSVVGAAMCILFNDGSEAASKRWSKTWALPEGCCLIEFQNELKVSGEVQHLAHISGVKSWVHLLPKASDAECQRQVLEGLKKWLNKNGDAELA